MKAFRDNPMSTVATHVIRQAPKTRPAAILRVPILLVFSFVTHDVVASDLDRRWAATLYAARISSEPGWEDVLVDPIGANYVDSFLAVAGLSREYAHYSGGALQVEAEGQIAYAFGDQRYWEFNAVPVVLRWQRFPWGRVVATSAAFGLGLSYTTELPDIEVELEGESRRLLVYWVAELTAGLPDKPWSVSLRLHHRSVAYGLMGAEGGMNAVGLGVRWRLSGVASSGETFELGGLRNNSSGHGVLGSSKTMCSLPRASRAASSSGVNGVGSSPSGTDPLRICPAIPSGSGKMNTRLRGSVPVFRKPTLTFRGM
jgi:hypothetical protein